MNLAYVQRNLISSIINFVYELLNDLSNNLRLLGKIVNEKKFQNWVEAQTSVQSLLQKLFFANSSQNLPKSKCQSFLAKFRVIFLLFAKYFVTDCKNGCLLN